MLSKKLKHSVKLYQVKALSSYIYSQLLKLNMVDKTIISS